MKGMVVLEMGVPPSMARRLSAAGAGTEMGAWGAVAVAKVNLHVESQILETKLKAERRKLKGGAESDWTMFG
jgi:hypothetical protein